MILSDLEEIKGNAMTALINENGCVVYENH